jgi:hypothetical protein
MPLAGIADNKSPCILDDKYRWLPVNDLNNVVVDNGTNVIFACPGTTFNNVQVRNLSKDGVIMLR